MSQDEVLRMVAKARDDASGPLRKVENALRSLGRQGGEQSRLFRENFRGVHEQLGKVAEIAKTGVAPAIDAIGISSLSAVGGMAALVAGLKNFVDQGDDIAAFGRRVQLTTDTIRGLEGVADKFHVDPGSLRQGEQAFTDAMYMIRRRRGDLFTSLLARRRDFADELAATPETTAGNEQALKSYLKVLEDVKKQHGEPTARAFSKEMTGTDTFVDLLRRGNAGLQEAIALTLKLRGNMDTEASEKWVSNWSDFKAAIEGVRNAVGNDLLPDLTEMAKQAQAFFAEHKVEIGRDIADSVRAIAAAMKDVNAGVQGIGGWKVVFEGLIALKLVSLAGNIVSVAAALGRLTSVVSAAPWLLRLLGRGAGPAVVDLDDRGIAKTTPEADKAINDALARAMGKGPTAPASAVAQNAASIIQGLRDRGLDAPHAAILAGNIEQESGFDPTRPNVAEGGIGLIQWRKERRAALQALAAQRHKLETDAGVQLDFMMNEFNETPQGRAFLATQNKDEMNRELHRHIRYGDNSEGRRLANGLALLPLAERTQPGSLLAAAGKSGIGGGVTTVTGSASLDVNVRAPPGTSVRADAKGLFDRVNVDRGLSLSKPLASE